MVYNKYFISLVFFSSIGGIIISLLGHNLEGQIVNNSRENKEEKNEKIKSEEKEVQKKEDTKIGKKEEKKDDKKEENEEEEFEVDYENGEKTEYGEDINKIDIIKGKLRIAASYATDNRYVYPTL